MGFGFFFAAVPSVATGKLYCKVASPAFGSYANGRQWSEPNEQHPSSIFLHAELCQCSAQFWNSSALSSAEMDSFPPAVLSGCLKPAADVVFVSREN